MAVMTDHDRTHNLELKSPSSITKDGNDAGTIADFFAHKNIFVTGGTGFLGTVLIEALLDATPDIGTIYLLVRGKKNWDPNQRVRKLLTKPIFEKYDEKTLAKVKPVVGELSEENFNFDDEILQELIENVNIIYHSAATIRFRSPLRTAIKTNLTGTMRTIELAKRLKNLSAYIYCSTAFCNSNNRGLILEEVYKSRCDPYEMMKMAEDDSMWENFTEEQTVKYTNDHPNTYTFTKNLSENLLMSEMKNMPVAIVRPSIVYGTWEKPCSGWVGNANSGHLGFLAGFIKGIFRTMKGRASAVIDIIPCDYVINSSLVMGWYVGTRKIEKPEVIHCTSGEVNPLTLSEFCDIINTNVQKHPPNSFVWKPKAILRNGWRYNLFFYLFHMLPAMVYSIPEKLFSVGMPQHTVYEYMRVFHRGGKAFDYFLDKNFRYDLKNALRIMSVVHEKDRKRYNFDSSRCDWTEFLARVIIGIRRFYFRESAETTTWHRIYWKVFDFLYYAGFVVLFLIFFAIFGILSGIKIGLVVSLLVWGFLVWL
uniref:Fatty acyl-CoA reductase n=2 Tax=Musca domestica TaxID=7370 RepID=A0A1I8MDW3_MUSDO